MTTATSTGDLFVLFDAPLRASKKAFELEVAVPGLPAGSSLRLTAASEGSPAFRLL